MRCSTCQRDPERMNNDWAECSHVDCQHRRASQPWVPNGRRAPAADSDTQTNDTTKGCTTCGSYLHTRSHCPWEKHRA